MDTKDKDRSRKLTGFAGEDLACEYLIGLGHTILFRNYRTGHLETDIISLDGDGIHFVEVKTRRAPVQGNPQDSVNVTKQRRLIAAARKFLARKDMRLLGDLETSFDIISIVFDGINTHLEYIPRAFIPLFL